MSTKKGNKSSRPILLFLITLVLIVTPFFIAYYCNPSRMVSFYSLQSLQSQVKTVVAQQPVVVDQSQAAGCPRPLLFIKTHKTAGSTLSRILVRSLCEVRKRNCFMPPPTNPGRIFDLRKRRDRAYVSSRGHFDVWAHHVMTPDLVREILDREILSCCRHAATLVISVCRRPAHRFASAWTWYGHSKTLNVSLVSFVEAAYNISSPSSSSSSSSTSSKKQQRELHNSSQFRYRTGLDVTLREIVGGGISADRVPEAFLALVQDMTRLQTFVVVADERFDESVVVLSALLGVSDSVYDFVYFRHKMSSREDAASTEMTEEQKEFLDEIQPLDKLLFWTANMVLDKAIAHYSSMSGNRSFDKDLATLRQANAVAAVACEAVDSGAHTGRNSTLDDEEASDGCDNMSSPSSWLEDLVRGAEKEGGLEQAISSTLKEPETRRNVRRFCASLRRDNNQAVRHFWERRRACELG